MVAAQRSQTLAAVAPLISGASAGSVAVRLVAGSVGWPLLGVTAGITLAMLYYDATKTAAIKAAVATPGAWSVEGYTGPLLGVLTAAGFTYVIYGDGRINNGCPASASLALFNLGFYTGQLIQNTLPLTAGPYCAMGKPTTAAGPFPTQGEATPATASQVTEYLSHLPASDPHAVESNTVSVGAQSSPTPSDSTASNPITSTDVATQVVPATQVQATDLVVDPNATKPAGTQTTETKTQGATTTTTTTTNPNGSTTEEQTDTASVSCAAGNHEPRSFGGILQAHMDQWNGSGLLSALNLLKTLTWPTTIPTYSLQSNLLGTFTLDFSAWSGMLTAIRSIIIAIAGFVAYRIVFVGSNDRLTQSDLLFPPRHDRQLQRHLVARVGFGARSCGCAARVGRDRKPDGADDRRSVRLAPGSHRPVSSDRHHCGSDGGAVSLQSVPFVRWGS